MKRVIFGLFIFFFNILPIYALSFDMDAVSVESTVSVGSKVNIDVFLKNIQGTSSGISSCELNIVLSDGIELDGSVKTYDNWQFTSGVRGYSFDTIDSILANTRVFTIPVIVRKSGSVKITDIVCTDIEDNQASDVDDIVTLNIAGNNSSSSSRPSSSSSSSKPSSSSSSSSKPSSSSLPTSSNPSSGSSSTNNVPSSSSSSNKPSSSSSASNTNGVYLKDLVITGGSINFSRDVFSYGVVVEDMNKFSVRPVVIDSSYMFDIGESYSDDTKIYTITLWDKDDNVQKYTLYVVEKSKADASSSLDNNKNISDYSYIFKAIIVILVLVNLGRIGYKLYKEGIIKF